MLNQFSRTELLLGKEAMNKLGNSRVAVFGIGGVGGYVCEALVRSGAYCLASRQLTYMLPLSWIRKVLIPPLRRNATCISGSPLWIYISPFLRDWTDAIFSSSAITSSSEIPVTFLKSLSLIIRFVSLYFLSHALLYISFCLWQMGQDTYMDYFSTFFSFFANKKLAFSQHTPSVFQLFLFFSSNGHTVLPGHSL